MMYKAIWKQHFTDDDVEWSGWKRWREKAQQCVLWSISLNVELPKKGSFFVGTMSGRYFKAPKRGEKNIDSLKPLLDLIQFNSTNVKNSAELNSCEQGKRLRE